MRGTGEPTGYCQCGCGGKTNIAVNNHTKRGHVKGRPYRYLPRHGCRKSGVDYVEQDCGHETPCWTWQLATTANGRYGQLTRDGRHAMAHRWYYEQRHGPVPHVLDHLCRNTLCVNPDHLEPVTQAENCRRGNRTKLTADDVRAIRASAEPRAVVAARFGVSKGTITDIRRRARWADVP